MLQAYVLSVLGVSYVCYKCFIWMLHIFAMATHMFSIFSGVLQVFHLFRTYIASVLSGCCKNRLSVAYVANRTHLPLPPTASSRVPPSGHKRSRVHMCGKRRGYERSPRGIEWCGRRSSSVGPHMGVQNGVQARVLSNGSVSDRTSEH
jgi:hypothetical protein